VPHSAPRTSHARTAPGTPHPAPLYSSGQVLPPPPAYHPGFGTIGLPELLMIFVLVLILFGFSQLGK